jgi:hypothetical protein
MLLRQSGHARELRITTSEHALHIARWLKRKEDGQTNGDRGEPPMHAYLPAVDGRHDGFLVLTNNTEACALGLVRFQRRLVR